MNTTNKAKIGFAARASAAALIAAGALTIVPMQPAFATVMARAGYPPQQGTRRAAKPGVLIHSVRAGSPAEKAGLKVNERIVAINGKPIANFDDLQAAIAAKKAGDAITIDVHDANNVSRIVTVTLADMPGKTGTPYIGVAVEQGDRVRVKRGNQPQDSMQTTASIEVYAVAKDSPAEKAGLKVGDSIVTVDGKPVKSASELRDVVHAKKPGDMLKLGVPDSADVNRVITATLTEDPKQPSAAYLGVSVENRRDEFYPEMPFGRGWMLTGPVIVGEVKTDSPASKAGLKAGDVIKSVDGKPVNNFLELKLRIVSAKIGDTLKVEFTRNRATKSVEIHLAESATVNGTPYLGITIKPTLPNIPLDPVAPIPS